MKFRKNVSLAKYTTFKIGGPAKYFYIAKTKQDLIKAIKAAKELGLPFFVLGGGSNLLVLDKGFDGLVIKCQMSNVNFLPLKAGFKIVAGAGLPLGKLVSASAEKSLTGLEWAVGIPGTVGGAIRGNSGAFEKSISNIVKEVEVLEITEDNSPQIKILKNKDCKFQYRDSIFKHNSNLIILSAEIQLKKGDKKEIQKKIKEHLEQRKKTQPLGFPSAGSIFKNPEGFSAGELIEKCGLKGKKINGAQISEIHSNFIVNLGDAKAKDVEKLIKLIKQKVKQKFGIVLKQEIEIF
ncbi:UDP-N-acetylmuramate dehydrogenase [Candidatus Parcubacteria bacterium]|nr:UDP-N-acetylmuramate dehydrogenase [Candidatus Parcubacteria bacterium]